MSKVSNDGMAQLKHLRTAYDAAFRHWMQQVQMLQSLTSHSPQDGRALEEARSRVEQAEMAYRNARNLLTDFMLVGPAVNEDSRFAVLAARSAAEGARQASEGGEDRQAKESHVRGLAYALWEDAGRPKGSADDDWRRAEQLVGEVVP